MISCGDDEDEVAITHTTVYDTVRTEILHHDTVRITIYQNELDGVYAWQLYDYLDKKSDMTLFYDIKIIDKNPNLDSIWLSIREHPDIKINLDLRACRELEEISNNRWGTHNLYGLTLPENLKAIGNYTFDGCTNLTEIVIPDGVTHIGENAFRYCTSLQKIHLPDGLTCISEGMLDSCVNLQHIVIPESVTNIGEHAFEKCTNLTNIKFEGTTPPKISDRYWYWYNWYNTDAFAGFEGNISVPFVAVEAYKKADGWSKYADRIVGY